MTREQIRVRILETTEHGLTVVRSLLGLLRDPTLTARDRRRAESLLHRWTRVYTGARGSAVVRDPTLTARESSAGRELLHRAEAPRRGLAAVAR